MRMSALGILLLPVGHGRSSERNGKFIRWPSFAFGSPARLWPADSSCRIELRDAERKLGFEFDGRC